MSAPVSSLASLNDYSSEVFRHLPGDTQKLLSTSNTVEQLGSEIIDLRYALIEIDHARQSTQQAITRINKQYIQSNNNQYSKEHNIHSSNNNHGSNPQLYCMISDNNLYIKQNTISIHQQLSDRLHLLNQQSIDTRSQLKRLLLDIQQYRSSELHGSTVSMILRDNDAIVQSMDSKLPQQDEESGSYAFNDSSSSSSSSNQHVSYTYG